MDRIEGLTIREAEYIDKNGRACKLAVLIYIGVKDPEAVLDWAVQQYVRNDGYHELIDKERDNPWVRVLLSEINELKEHVFVSGQFFLSKSL